MKKQFFLLLACANVSAQSPKILRDRIDQYMRAQVTTHQFSGTVLVTQKGKVIYDNAFGLANREWKVPNTPDTKFPVCSLAKQFTAAAILQLQEQGKLKTSDVLAKYFPDYPKGDQVTLRMLLNHTSGIRECSLDARWFATDPNLPIAQLKDTILKTFKLKPYDFEPGTFWKYSNSGYLLLGFVIEQVSGEKYADYIRKNLLEKAGMTQSGSLVHDAIVPQLADGYSLLTGKWTKGETRSVEIGFSAGNLYSTTHDLDRWRDALMSGKIIGPVSLQEMDTPNHEDRGAGYGIFVDRFFGKRALHHGGAMSGVNTFMIDYPDDGLRIIILTNRDTNLDFVHKGLAGIVFGYDVLPTHVRKRQPVDSSLLANYTGTFQTDNIPFPINLVQNNDKLYWRIHRDIELVPESNQSFYIDEPDVEFQVEFELTNDKQIKTAYVIEGGVKMIMKKT
ncbi:serine hydrolase domain-containing protein [Flavobacterium caeni]|uniref:CubicO group peptidase, beta-lactamase class C family n=1 Tax=Flavobacterium caeni TaxID=490189 RepID=A0A1G5GF61_9FLAO|nr:serine hydrolase domain-containing protein [Flavobacterium caeni]SCY50144.1 CubicO group peptidase, beta-lactamase class C family [Flavobacterium caeni]